MEIDVLGTEVAIDTSFLEEDAIAVREQVRAYCRGELRSFDVSVAFPDGFLGEVMGQLEGIPYGETRSYGEIAAQLDSVAVAVGQACGRNPVPIIIPCHRVVASDGIGGYQYPGLKERLLDLES